MSIKYDCQKFLGDNECNRCSVMGYIFDCPAECEEYTDFFGRQPNKTDIEKQLKGEA